jgi:ketosteroid isomerase-like protein
LLGPSRAEIGLDRYYCGVQGLFDHSLKPDPHMRPLALASLGLLAIACAPKSEPAVIESEAAPLSAAALDSVKAVDAAFAAGMNAKDTMAVFAVYADGAKLMPPDAPIMEMPAARSVLTGFIAGGATNFVLNPVTAYGIGDLAYVVGTVKFVMGGATNEMKYAEVLRRGTDGKWRYVVDMVSSVAPAAAPPAAKK